MKRTGARHGFTLIELLVVIAIIALLAGILFPVFLAVKKSSYKAVCASNLKQFGGAFQMYAGDYGDRMPLPGGSIPNGMGWIYDDTSGTTHNDIGALWPYIRTKMKTGISNNFWSCPLAVPAVNSGNGGAFFSPGQNYIMNEYLHAGFSGEGNFNQSVQGYLMGLMYSTCPFPSRVILLYEGVQDANGVCSRMGSPFYIKDASPLRPSANKAFANMKYANICQNWHNGRSNFLFIDGHVALMNPAMTLDQTSYNSSVGTISYWKRIYQGYGPADLWNPHVSTIVYP